MAIETESFKELIEEDGSLAAHSSESHPTLTILVNNDSAEITTKQQTNDFLPKKAIWNNKKKCEFCDFVGFDLVEHRENAHSLTLLSNNVYKD